MSTKRRPGGQLTNTLRPNYALAPPQVEKSRANMKLFTVTAGDGSKHDVEAEETGHALAYVERRTGMRARAAELVGPAWKPQRLNIGSAA